MINGPREILVRARRLRGEMSLPKVILWKEQRLRPGGHKFRRQHPAGVYILDFFCAAARLAIEVDGWGHESPDVRKKDQTRSAFLRTQGIATMRVPAKVVLGDVQVAVARIVEVCSQRIPAR